MWTASPPPPQVDLSAPLVWNYQWACRGVGAREEKQRQNTVVLEMLLASMWRSGLPSGVPGRRAAGARWPVMDQAAAAAIREMEIG